MTSTFPIELSPIPKAGAICLPFVAYVETYVRRLGTLISPNLMAMAKHYAPPIGVAVTFNGTLSTVKEYAYQNGDALIVRLNDPLVTEIAPAPIATPDEVRQGRNFICVALKDKTSMIAGKTSLGVVYSNNLMARFSQMETAKLQPGDSGAPVFVDVNGQWKLAGTNYAITPTAFFSNLLGNFSEHIKTL
jgi:hypothetical protein